VFSLISAARRPPDVNVGPGSDLTDPVAVKGHTMSWGRVARVFVLALFMSLVGTGAASAAPPPAGNAAFATAGVQVYPLDTVGMRCSAFGYCDGVASELAGTAVPQYLSSRPGEAVAVTCRSADLAQVRGFFGRGEDVVTGWVNAGMLRMRRQDAVPACGMLV